ncbi:cytochrome c nitrite reductase small subunit [bacterium]|nr:cytochrome c nitrite reductase small subunit [bacterium]
MSRPVLMIFLGVLAGATAGIGGYTFVYAKGYSYLTDNPAACANCHVMRDHLDGWIKSSHRSAAVCNDCHTPAGFAGKYAVKASNGFWHSFAFTTGRFHEPIRIKERNRRVLEESCRRCHADIVEALDGPHRGTEHILCVKCHAGVGHEK